MENFSLAHLSLVSPKKDILLDIPGDMYPFSVFGSVHNQNKNNSSESETNTEWSKLRLVSEIKIVKQGVFPILLINHNINSE